MQAPKSMRQCFVALWTIILILVCPLASIAQTAKYNDSLTVQGFSQPGRIALVASAIPGIVRTLHVREGDIVLAGDVLLQLDRSVHDEKLNLARLAKEARGELQSAEAELNASRSRLERIRELADRQHATPSELLQAQEDVQVAEANLRRAADRREQQVADYKRLLAEADQFEVKAPFDGVVVELKKELGEFVGPGESTVCTIADLSTLSVEFMVPRSLRHRLNVENRIEILFTYANQTVEGTIEYISPFPNGETNTYTLKARVSNIDGKLTAGERCQVQTETLSQNVSSDGRSKTGTAPLRRLHKLNDTDSAKNAPVRVEADGKDVSRQTDTRAPQYAQQRSS